ncbi:MAG: hypothetical protein B7Z15_06850 [Rhizobiales bacterium 32-66-8]|nr:MAG: hypothetical protein B7Z15_06850 [Rhizobiales bacterium 32-66-8]
MSVSPVSRPRDLVLALLALPLVSFAGPTSAAEPVQCLQGEGFQVAYRERADSVGTDIVVRSVTGTGKPACTLLDQGTGPDRTLSIIDLATRKPVVSVGYDDNEPVEIKPGSVSFWAVTGKGTAANCPAFKEYSANGLEAALIRQTVVSLPEARSQASGPSKCIAQQ